MDTDFTDMSHRPFPIPTLPWIGKQTWNDILFCHWPISSDILETWIPSALALDLYNGTAWLGYVLFQVSDIRLRLFPKIPYFNSYIGLNVRTYVTYKGTPGIYFFNLDASKLFAVIGGKVGTLLPFRKSNMTWKKRNPDYCFIGKTETMNQQIETFDVRFRPKTNPYVLPNDCLPAWLYERYCFFIDSKKQMYRGDIHHARWKVSDMDIQIKQNSMASFLPRTYFEQQPLIHYSSIQHAYLWPLRKA